MSDDLWIVIPNWAKFQHYSDRTPPWIKLYLELNSDDAWLDLTTAERGLLITIWIEFARSRGHLRVEKVRRLCRGSAREKHFTSLNHAGFIQLSASKPSRARAAARSKEGLVVPTKPLERASKSAANGGADLPSPPETTEKPARRVPNASAYELYEPHELERDPDAIRRVRELREQIGL